MRTHAHAAASCCSSRHQQLPRRRRRLILHVHCITMSSSKQKMKSLFMHYGSGSGSDSESDPNEQDDDDQQQADDKTTGAAGEAGAGSRIGDGFSEDEDTNNHWSSAKEFHQSLRGKSVDHIRIPMRNQGPVDPQLVEQFEKLRQMKETKGQDMKYEIQKRKDFRNPSIYEKLIDHCKIREFGSNFPTDIFDPDDCAPESYYEKLSIAQKDLMEQSEKETHPKVEIVHAVAKKQTSSTSASAASSDPSRKKRSKWDEGPAAKR